MISRVCSFLHCSNIKAFNQHIGVSNVHYRAELSTYHPNPHPTLHPSPCLCSDHHHHHHHCPHLWIVKTLDCVLYIEGREGWRGENLENKLLRHTSVVARLVIMIVIFT